jgi:hypothetical protein
VDLERLSFLDTRQAAKFLTDHGFKTSPATLDTKRTRGGGPSFRRFGPRFVYVPPELLEWARSRLSDPVTNTSEARVA